MNIDELRKRAKEIGHVTDDYEIEIEDFQSETDRAVFVWNHKKDPDSNVWVEFMANGILHNFSIDGHRPNHPLHFSSDELLEKALEFVHHYIPIKIDKFKQERWVQLETGGGYRLEYSQYERDLPVPFTGFYVLIQPWGEITGYHYDGLAENIRLSDLDLNLEKIKGEFLEGLELNLTITEIHSDLYEPSDHLPHLVYEPCWTYRFNSEIGKIEKINSSEEKSESLLPVSKLSKDDSKTFNELIGFDPNQFELIREVDMGSVTGMVWREKNNISKEEELSIEGYFHKRNDYTLKILLDKETDKLNGVYSFLNKEGELDLSFEDCKELAEEMLFKLYPTADQYFQFVKSEENDEESKCFHYEYSFKLGGVPVRFGSVRISVNPTTGTIDHLISSDVNPESLQHFDPTPNITVEEAKKIVSHQLEVSIQWKKEYTENQESFYTLTYVPSFPRLNGELAFLDAKTGEIIINRLK